MLIILAAIYPRTESKEKTYVISVISLSFNVSCAIFDKLFKRSINIHIYTAYALLFAQTRKKFSRLYMDHYSLAIILLMKRGLVAFLTLIVFLLSFMCLCSVSLPCGSMSWSVVCACGSSLSYSLVFCMLFFT